MIQLIREFENMQKLSHHNILKVIEMHIDIEKGYVFYVMEYYKSTTLTAFVEPENKIEPSSIKKLFKELVDGVQYLHSKSVVHRDLSPNNILIMKKTPSIDQSNQPALRIIDFNVAKFFEAEDLNDKASKFKFSMLTETGTIKYRAPEIFKQEGCYTEAIDIWSLGCNLYRMVEGKDPFDSE